MKKKQSEHTSNFLSVLQGKTENLPHSPMNASRFKMVTLVVCFTRESQLPAGTQPQAIHCTNPPVTGTRHILPTFIWFSEWIEKCVAYNPCGQWHTSGWRNTRLHTSRRRYSLFSPFAPVVIRSRRLVAAFVRVKMKNRYTTVHRALQQLLSSSSFCAAAKDKYPRLYRSHLPSGSRVAAHFATRHDDRNYGTSQWPQPLCPISGRSAAADWPARPSISFWLHDLNLTGPFFAPHILLDYKGKIASAHRGLDTKTDSLFSRGRRQTYVP